MIVIYECAAISLNNCYKDGSDSFKYTCAIDANGLATPSVAFYIGTESCSGTPSSTVLVPSGCSSHPDKGGFHNVYMYCTDHITPWTEHGSRYFISE